MEEEEDLKCGDCVFVHHVDFGMIKCVWFNKNLNEYFDGLDRIQECIDSNKKQ